MKIEDLIPLCKYIVAGGIAFVVDFAILYSLVEYASLHYIVATTIAFIASLSVNYIISRYFIFTKTDLSNKKSYSYFFGISLLGLLVINATMLLFVEVFNIHYLLARIFIAGTLGVGSFFIHKHFTFRVKEWEDDKTIIENVKRTLRREHRIDTDKENV